MPLNKPNLAIDEFGDDEGVSLHTGADRRIDLTGDRAIHHTVVGMSKEGFRAVMERREFAVRLQPIVQLSERKLIGFEALIRWKHPAFGLLPPTFFLKALIDLGMIVEVTQYVFDRVARFQKNVISANKVMLPVSVNVSAIQLQQTGMVAMIDAVLKKYKLPRHAIAVEMTETEVVTDLPAASRTISELRAYGVQVYADDIGHGFAAIGNLIDYDLSGMKLDRTFVQSIGNNPRSQSVIKNLALMAKDLNMSLTAEGVEHEYQVVALQAMGVSLGQGYLFGKPMSRVQALEMLQDAPSVKT